MNNNTKIKMKNGEVTNDEEDESYECKPFDGRKLHSSTKSGLSAGTGS